MKILEAQSAQLTNYEVFTHLTELKAKSNARKGNRALGRAPGNLETVVKEILDYFYEAPSPLGSKPFPYDSNTIKRLLARLREFRLTKAEIIMIMNLRPTKPENLNTIIEEMEGRFDDDQQMAIVAAIAEVLGKPDGEAERQAMTDNAKEARKEKSDMELKQEEVMDIDG
ncbi:hypothetical protein M430DRAFT_33060 [Amorphotheca resinae ATCC 22711]|uniref:DNA-directed RNA polymerase III subunit RPC9 n=1 Tax=Amorphotheca resinae ATCC 22711 TaxID=857342 RepID=A0A2T3BAJ6_AMORE|nr:hypothetical protein M430DRAFT_33060 [Amorphotheca resinae ATCC 22711]PSS25299.1 hypothetical protein M430DRAFT_33060 [Amorphotheca resinae ATCC 22711]